MPKYSSASMSYMNSTKSVLKLNFHQLVNLILKALVLSHLLPRVMGKLKG